MRSVDASAQYQWPPQDPTRLPNPPAPRRDRSAFTYGNGSFNPDLRPTSSSTSALNGDGHEEHTLRHRRYSQGSAGSTFSEASGSTPERYLSDYDYDDSAPLDDRDREAEERRRMRPFVPPRARRGSEGLEVRTGVAAWNMDVEHQVQAHEAWHRGGGAVWMEEGRYNVYDPDVGDQDEEYDSDDT